MKGMLSPNAVAWVQFGQPMRMVRCNSICEDSDHATMAWSQDRWGRPVSSTAYQIQIGGPWGNSWRRVWVAQGWNYVAQCDGEWFRIGIDTGV